MSDLSIYSKMKKMGTFGLDVYLEAQLIYQHEPFAWGGKMNFDTDVPI